MPLYARNEIKDAEEVARESITSKNPDDAFRLQLKIDDRHEHLTRSKETLPEGATLRFRGAQGSGPFLVSMRKQNGEWIVDTRWWDAAGRLANRAVPEKGEPEHTIKVALLKMLQNDRERLSEHFVSGTPIDSLFPPDYSPSNLSHLYELVGEMPVVEVSLDELFMGPEGNYIRVGDLPGQPEKVFIGQYGVIDLIFRMKREDGEWKLLPAGYLLVMEAW